MNTFELSSALRSVVSSLHKRLRKQIYSTKTLSITEIQIMGYLYRQNARLPSELAALTKIKAQSVSQILNRLEKEKLIERHPSKDDRRKTNIVLTEYSKKMVEQTRYERDEWLASAVEKNLSDDEKEILINAISILNKLAEAE